MQNSKIQKYNLIFFTFFVIFLFGPLLLILKEVNLSSIYAFITNTNNIKLVKNSITSTLVASVISVVIGFFAAYSLQLYNIKYKSFIEIIIFLPMLIPSISVSISLLNLFGYSGIITNLLNLDFQIQGFLGIILGSIIYSFPISYIMLSNGFNYVDRNLYIVSDTLKIPKLSQFITITLKYMKKPIISTFFAVFALIFTDYGVPMSIGGKYKTLSVFMYEEVIGMHNYNQGYIVSLFLFIPAILNFIYSSFSTTSDNLKEGKNSNKFLLKSNIFIELGLFFISIVLIILILSFVFLVFTSNYPYDNSFTINNFKKISTYGLNKFLINSLIISFLTSIIGTTITFFLAYITSMNKYSFSSSILKNFSIFTLTVPGVVLGLSYLVFFKGTPLYGNYIILALVNIIHFFGTPYLMFENALDKTDPNLNILIKTLNIPQKNYVIDILIPSILNTIIDSSIYFFNNSMITISAITFLYTQRTKPISLELNTFINAQMNYEGIALVSILILIVNLLLRFIGNKLKKIYNGGIYNEKK